MVQTTCKLCGGTEMNYVDDLTLVYRPDGTRAVWFPCNETRGNKETFKTAVKTWSEVNDAQAIALLDVMVKVYIIREPGEFDEVHTGPLFIRTDELEFHNLLNDDRRVENWFREHGEGLAL